jgi:glycosyltransferase involved in cell wall biosynthesis
MYLGDLFGSVAALLANRHRIVWNVRHADLSMANNKFHTIAAARLCALLGQFVPNRIVFCSEESRRLHERKGYPRRKGVLIENGVDTQLFRPNPAAHVEIREELNIPQDALLIGLIARFDPLKDHVSFIRVAETIIRAHPDACFLLCGREVTKDNPELWKQICKTGFPDRFRLTGQRADMPRVMAALDIICSSSMSESFPNAIAEAMCCGVPCVATDVGATARIVGDCGSIVPPCDPQAFTAALREMLAMTPATRLDLGVRARRHILQHFDQSASTAQYASLYMRVSGHVVSRTPQSAEVSLL